MNPASIPVDLRNPGQVFACLGLMEATEILTGPCTGRFVYSSPSTAVHFELATEGSSSPVEKVLRFLTSCEVVAIAPPGTEFKNEKPDFVMEPAKGLKFPAPIPKSKATLPVRLRNGGVELPIEYWLDGRHCGRDNVKFWSGMGGYPGAALARDAVNCLGRLQKEAHLLESVGDPFSVEAPMSSSFRFDWRRDYIPLDAGFSPNKHGERIRMVGYPLVELLAAVGLQYARPARINKWAYRYCVSNVRLPVVLARVVLGSETIAIPKRQFRMHLGTPADQGDERCIIDAEEEF